MDFCVGDRVVVTSEYTWQGEPRSAVGPWQLRPTGIGVTGTIVDAGEGDGVTVRYDPGCSTGPHADILTDVSCLSILYDLPKDLTREEIEQWLTT